MSIRLTDWLAPQSQFCDRDATVQILSALLEKQHSARTERPSFATFPAAHYNQQATQVEHLARLMWGAVPAGCDAEQYNRAFAAQLVAGCDEQHPDFWGTPSDFDQRVVEMSSFAVAMVDCPECYFMPLSQAQQAQRFAWLRSVETLKLPPNNWRLFRILILAAIAKLGGEIDQQVLADDLDFIDQHYLGQGWYQDGPNKVMDNYNPFAFHLYGLIYARWCGEQDPERCQRWLARAIEFAQSYQAWFGDDGAQLVYGRSLNYRFASAAFWAELAYFEPQQFPPGLLRSLWASTMRWWANQPIWSENAELLSGFAYPNLLASEFYTSSASPFLAFKAFSALRLPAKHSFWQADEQPLASHCAPLWVVDQHLIWRSGGSYLLTNAPASGELRHSPDKYLKFAYSSDHGLCVEGEKWIEQGFVGDNLLAFYHPETQQWFGRRKHEQAYREGDALISIWQPFAGCKVTTVQSMQSNKEVRTHHIESDRALNYIATGYAVDRWQPWGSQGKESAQALVQSERLYSQIELVQGPGNASVYPCAPNTNLLYAHASVPVISGTVSAGNTCLATEISAGRTANRTALKS